MTLSRESMVQSLARKYRTLITLRRDKLQGRPLPPRDVFRALANEFPGALRELDVLPLETISTRLEALDHAHTTNSTQPWMLWMHAYHQWMRAALHIKLRLRANHTPSPIEINAVMESTARMTELPMTPAFVCKVAAPAHGRLNHVVFEHVAHTHACTVEQIENVLFPTLQTR